MILIVDDIEEVCNLLLKFVEIAGTEGHSEHDGHAAILWLATHRPDLVIMDVNMPGMSGIDVLRLMKRNATLSDIPVLMHTASGDQTIPGEASELGAIATLIKGSYSAAHLINLIRSYIGTASSSPPVAA